MSLEKTFKGTGYEAKAGQSGPSGPSGPTGPVDNSEGQSGASGAEQETGPTGATGPTGPDAETGASGPSGAAQSGPSPSTEIDEARILEAINKKRGTNFQSLDEINAPAPPEPTAAELAARDQERRANVRAYALQNKKITTTELDEYVTESAKPYIELALDLYKAERIEAMRKAGVAEAEILDDAALETEFNDLNFQYAKADDVKRIKAENRLQAEVQGYLESKYQKIFDLDDDYEEHVATTTARSNYNSTVDDVFTQAGTEFAEMTFEVAGDKPEDKIPYTFKVTPEVFQKVKNSYLSDNSFNVFGQGALNASILKQAVRNSIVQEAFGQILSEVANAHRTAGMNGIQKGRRNIPDKESGSDVKKVVENPTIKKILGKKENQAIINN